MILAEISMNEFSAGLERTRTVLIPFGSLEAHGPHLPLGTDATFAEELCREASRRVPAFVAPTVAYGVMRSTRQHPGTAGITPATLRQLTRDLVRDYYRQGLRAFVLISGHASGIQISCLQEAGEELLEELPGLQLAVLSVLDLCPQAWAEQLSTPGDSHAGEMETSVLLYLRPNLVGSERPEEWPQFPPHVLVRDKRRYWPGAVWGDSRPASSAKGKQLVEVAVSSLVRLVAYLSQQEAESTSGDKAGEKSGG